MEEQIVPEREVPLIILCGTFPPPVHGMAAVNDAILNLLANYRPIVIDLSRSLVGISWRGYLKKTMRALSGCLSILILPIRRDKRFYSSVDDGLGSLLIALLAMTARLRNCRIVLHHHSYKYVTNSAWYMRLLVRVAGRGATHVFLCEQMEHDFRARYPGPYRALICTNPVTDQQLIKHFERIPNATPMPILTIGFISNLMFEKGIRDFIDVLVQAPSHGIELHGIMAGPPITLDVQSFLDTACRELNGRLKLLGSVDGARKIAFFESIDVLLFPTRYPTEAFGLVLMEGLFAGCPLITYGRGCIPILAKLDTSKVLPPEVDFASAALVTLTAWSRTRDGLSALKGQAHQDGVALHRSHIFQRRALVDEIIGRRLSNASSQRRHPVHSGE